jgi:3-hydroxyisobutyrate dehydrogenase-like beta-hydroxyacid dehydrogenase
MMQGRQFGTRIAFVGLGSMGAALAGRLLYRNQVHGTNRTRSKAGALIDAGLIWHDTPREVAAEAEVVFSMVSDDAALAAITSGPDGILAGLRPGALYIDMSTVSPSASRDLAKRVGSAGATMVDAPVSGSVHAAESGTLAIMVGGTEAGYRAAEALLLRLGSSVTHVGGNGEGLLLKLATSMSVAAQMVAYSEGIELAERGGIDPALAARAMTESAIGSPKLKAGGPRVLNLPEQARCDVSRMCKDIRLALETARASGVRLPVAAAVGGALGQAENTGYGLRDLADLYDAPARS